MLVYRVQNKSGNGPYGPYYSLEKWQIKLCKSHQWRRPWLNESGLLAPGSKQFCACENLRELKMWFRGWWKQLQLHGYYIAVYKVPEKYVEIGDRQLLFIKRRARLIERIEI